MSLDRYLQTNIMQVAPERTVGVIAGVWLVTVAIAAAWMLAVLFPFEPSFNFQAARHKSASVISNAGAQAVKGDRLTSAKPWERRAVERIGAKSAPVSTGEQKIPVGCEPAFSRIVKSGNFTARCVT